MCSYSQITFGTSLPSFLFTFAFLTYYHFIKLKGEPGDRGSSGQPGTNGDLVRSVICTTQIEKRYMFNYNQQCNREPRHNEYACDVKEMRV